MTLKKLEEVEKPCTALKKQLNDCLSSYNIEFYSGSLFATSDDQNLTEIKSFNQENDDEIKQLENLIKELESKDQVLKHEIDTVAKNELSLNENFNELKNLYNSKTLQQDLERIDKLLPILNTNIQEYNHILSYMSKFRHIPIYNELFEKMKIHLPPSSSEQRDMGEIIIQCDNEDCKKVLKSVIPPTVKVGNTFSTKII